MGQQELVDKLLKITRMIESKPMGSPVEESKFEDAEDSVKLVIQEESMYISKVGSFLYIVTRSRPDVAVAKSMLASYVDKPRERHMTIARRVLRYLIGTKGKMLLLKPGVGNQLTTYIDASWANKFEKRGKLNRELKSCIGTQSWRRQHCCQSVSAFAPPKRHTSCL